MAPSVKKLAEFWPHQASELRSIIAGNRDPGEYNSVRQWVAQCYHRPSDTEQRLAAVNEVIGGYGVEAISCGSGRVRYSYINTGDPYTATVVYDHDFGCWIVGDWGTIVERDADLQ